MEVMQQQRAEVENKKEVLHHFKEEVEEVVEEAFLVRRRSANIPANSGGNSTTSTGEVTVDLDTSKMEGVVNGEGDQKAEKSEEIVYFDKNEGTGPEWSHFNVKVENLGAKLKNVDIHQVLKPVINGREVDNLKNELLPSSNLPTSTKPQLQEETEHAEVDEELEEGDEEVIELEFEGAVEKIHTHDGYNMYCPNCSNRITKVVLRRKIQRKKVQISSDAQRDDLFGCLSCFSIFIPSGRCLDLLRIFGKNDLNSQLPPAANINSSSPKITTEPRDQAIEHGGDVRIPVEETPVETRIPQYPPVTDVFLTDARIPVTIPEPQSSRSLEIVRSVVYGGLMESITSLSVVSSAAASDATTLNIVALGLANLVGGLVVLAHNLRDLRYGDSSETNENRYKEQLGGKEHFPLHATIAVLSYLVFGLIPPVIYGFTYRESDDRDYKLLAVAAASLLCIIILAIAKTYVRGDHKFMAYFKTIVYYVTAAVMVSGIAFAVGDLVHKLLEKLGWLKPSTVEHQLFPQTKSFNPTSRASY